MPISIRRLKKTVRKQKGAQQINPGGMVYMKHPFSTMPREAVLKGLIEIGKTHQDEFPSRLELVDPYCVLSIHC